MILVTSLNFSIILIEVGYFYVRIYHFMHNRHGLHVKPMFELKGNSQNVYLGEGCENWNVNFVVENYFGNKVIG